MFEVLSREIAFLKSAFAVLWLGKPEGVAYAGGGTVQGMSGLPRSVSKHFFF